MLVWLIFAAMTVAALVAVLRPVLSGRPSASDRDADVAVYRDQLDEVARDRERGLIGTDEAEAARVEIARRLLRAAGSDKTAIAAVPARHRGVVVALSIAIPILAVGLYGIVGSPLTADAPLAARLSEPPERQQLGEQIARVEAHLSRNPDDGRGWEVLAPVYLRLGRVDDAVAAWRNVLRLMGSTVARETGFGQALVVAAGGVVTEEAKEAFRRALAADPKTIAARMYLAVSTEQDGRRDEARAAWAALLGEAKGDEPWAAEVRAQLARLDGKPAKPPVETADPAKPAGPSEADVAAAAEMTPAQRQAMVEGMVASLAARLEANGGTVEEWLRLIRAQAALGRAAEARAAAVRARESLKADAAAVARIDDVARRLGIEL